GPPPGIGWVADRERSEDGNPDRIRYLIARPEPWVAAVDSQRNDGSDRRAGYRAEQGVNGIHDDLLDRARPGTACRWLQQLGLDLAARIAGRVDIGNIALGDGIGICRCIASIPC